MMMGPPHSGPHVASVPDTGRVTNDGAPSRLRGPRGPVLRVSSAWRCHSARARTRVRAVFGEVRARSGRLRAHRGRVPCRCVPVAAMARRRGGGARGARVPAYRPDRREAFGGGGGVAGAPTESRSETKCCAPPKGAPQEQPTRGAERAGNSTIVSM